MEKIFVVGGGPSLKNFDFKLLTHYKTIAVNKSVFDLENPTYFITMDYSFTKKIGEKAGWLLTLDCPKIFVAGLDVPHIVEKEGRFIDTRFNMIYDLYMFDVIIKSYKRDGLSLSLAGFRNGWNSGYCGLQLAIALGYTEIYLLGIDLCVNNNDTHYHGGYGEPKEKLESKLEIYYQLFKEGLNLAKIAGIKVYSCSPISRLNEIIPYVNIKEVL